MWSGGDACATVPALTAAVSGKPNGSLKLALTASAPPSCAAVGVKVLTPRPEATAEPFRLQVNVIWLLPGANCSFTVAVIDRPAAAAPRMRPESAIGGRR